MNYPLWSLLPGHPPAPSRAAAGVSAAADYFNENCSACHEAIGVALAVPVAPTAVIGEE